VHRPRSPSWSPLAMAVCATEQDQCPRGTDLQGAGSCWPECLPTLYQEPRVLQAAIWDVCTTLVCRCAWGGERILTWSPTGIEGTITTG
jgi:hypothetical protein